MLVAMLMGRDDYHGSVDMDEDGGAMKDSDTGADEDVDGEDDEYR